MSDRSYRPSCGSEGMDFAAKFCDRCFRDRSTREDPPDYSRACPIIASVLAFDIDSPEYPPEWVEDDQGSRCTAFVAALEKT